MLPFVYNPDLSPQVDSRTRGLLDRVRLKRAIDRDGGPAATKLSISHKSSFFVDNQQWAVDECRKDFWLFFSKGHGTGDRSGKIF